MEGVIDARILIVVICRERTVGERGGDMTGGKVERVTEDGQWEER